MTAHEASLPFAAIWLRDNCPCADSRDPRSGQKLYGVTDIPADIYIGEFTESGESISVTFGPDGHRSKFSRVWLDGQRAGSAGDGRTELDKQLWEAADLDGRLPESDWSAYRDNSREQYHALLQVQELGFVILRGTPIVDRTVITIAETFGFVRETNYGRLFDVRVEAHASNLAFTGRPIAPHTDNPYRDPVPTLQLLHCVSNAVKGGESSLLDGFHAAAVLRAQDPTSFETLTRSPVRFAWSDGDTALQADRPIIEVDARARIREVRFNNRSMAPRYGPSEPTIAFYAAYRRFAEILSRPELPVRFRLEAGDCVIFDNTRLLHARTAFDQAGRRHLQGCYADLDALASTIRRASSGG